MHEMSTVEKVINELNEKRPKSAKVILGKMAADKDHFLSMFSEIAKGTPAEQVDLVVEQVPVRAKCGCGFEGIVDVPGHVHFVRCPKCGKVADVLEGNEVEIII